MAKTRTKVNPAGDNPLVYPGRELRLALLERGVFRRLETLRFVARYTSLPVETVRRAAGGRRIRLKEWFELACFTRNTGVRPEVVEEWDARRAATVKPFHRDLKGRYSRAIPEAPKTEFPKQGRVGRPRNPWGTDSGP